MTEKILGYILITIGILIIFFSGYSVYQVFTKQEKPVQLFNFKGITLDTNQLLAGSLPPEIAQTLPKNTPKQELISADLLNDSSNLLMHLMFMGFILNVGYKLASI